VPIYVLAAAAREITTALCIKRGIESFLDIAQQEHAQLSREELHRIASRHAGFFKHADRDPDAQLTDYPDDEATHALYIASFDFGLLCGGKPVEAQVFDCWHMAIYFPKEEVAPKIFELLPGIREASSREKQIELGRPDLGKITS
jgi:hypothetical protein